MNCFDWAGMGRTTPAVAICTDCAAGIGPDHAHVVPGWLTRAAVISRTVVVELPPRTIRCGVCRLARDAATPGRAAAS